MFSSFYESLNSTKEYYYKFPGTEMNSAKPGPFDINVPFSGEEIFGKYLDLNSNFLEFVNMSKKHFPEQDYLQYLDRFNTFFYIPEELRTSKPYLEYLQNLWKYLEDFFRRVHPLIDLDAIIHEWEVDFINRVKNGEVRHARLPGKSGHAASHQPQPLRLGMFNDCKELEALGMDRLKEGLESLGLKCGGTLQDRAQRLWSVRGKKEADIPPSLRAKKASKRKLSDTEVQEEMAVSAGGEGGREEEENEKRVLSLNMAQWLEFKIGALCESMQETVSHTRRHAEKQQARSIEEKEAEIREEEFGLLPDIPEEQQGQGGGGGGGGEEDDDDAPIYNPLNIPLGWDGKPIPYWLYKLHGLGIE